MENKYYLSLRKIIKEVLLLGERLLLWPVQKYFGPMLLKELTPYDVKGFEKKIRLGDLYNNGYVIPEAILPMIQVEYCYGVGHFINFEEALLERVDIPIRLYDHTVAGLPIKHRSLFFKKQGIAKAPRRNFDTFLHHVRENGDGQKKILLKMDIEGDEWKVLGDIVREASQNIVAIVLEIHYLYRYEKISQYIETLRSLNSHFTLVHLHGNNCSVPVKFGPHTVHSTIELTLINNSLAKEKTPLQSSLPSSLDYPSNYQKPDSPLDFWKNNGKQILS